MMVKLINNEFIKVKKSKLIFTQIIYLLAVYIMYRVSDKSITDIVFNLIPFIGIVVCIIYGGTISKEKESGSFRYYLTKPVKRWKIYLSKIISIIIYILVSITLIIIFTCMLSGNFDTNFIYKYYIYSVPIIFIGFFVLYLSTIFKSQVFSSCTSIVVLSFSLIIAQVLFGIKLTFVEYTFMPYLDYSLFNDEIVLQSINNELQVNLSLNRGILIDIIYMIIFYIIGSYKFIKKDIKS